MYMRVGTGNIHQAGMGHIQQVRYGRRQWDEGNSHGEQWNPHDFNKQWKRHDSDGQFGTSPKRAVGNFQRKNNPSNNTATFDRILYKGKPYQRADGRITINGRTYRFRSGGGGYTLKGRGHLPPGVYRVTRHMDSRRDKKTMMRDGVGYSFALSDKYDKRIGSMRTYLRIHPDGLGPGTIGCIGIVGDGSVQRRFRADMLAELKRNGGSFKLRVGM